MRARALTLILWTILQHKAGNVHGQCSGQPTYILPNNSTGNLAFPEANLDLITGSWQNNQMYPTSVSCTWIIMAPPLHVLYTKFLHFDTEEGFDYVTLFDSLDQQNEFFHFSGDLKENWEAVTPDNVLVLRFFADDLTSYHGFHLAYRYMPKACIADNVVIDEPQLIAMPPWNLQGILPGPIRPGFEPPNIGAELSEDMASPSGPRWMEISTYPQGFNCTWHIQVTPKQLLRVDVLKFQTDPDDVLEVWKLEGQQPIPLVKYSFNDVPQSRIHSSSPLVLKFFSIISGQEVAGPGFLLNITYISRACSSEPQELVSPKGYIAYPSGNLEHGVWEASDLISYGPDSCEWHLIAPDGYSFNLTILEFDTSPQDQLVIYDGMNRVFKHGGGTPSKRTLVSSSNSVVVQFHSDADTKRTGFLLQYAWFLRSCQYELEGSEGELRSPFYPDTYGDGTRCQWVITAKPGQVVHFMIARLRMDHGDYLQITDGNKTIFLTQASLNNRILEFNPSPSVEIKFASNDNSNKGYFLLNYAIFSPGSCNFTLTSCGWTPVGRLQVWTLRENEGTMSAQEENTLGVQLPRGYQSQLISPLVDPSSLPDSEGLSHPTKGETPVCLRVSYFLSGQDAYKLTFSVVEAQSAKVVFNDEAPSKNVLSVHGPHGQFFLTAAVNFTISNPFKVLVSYMRGYGPHYRVGLQEIHLNSGTCGPDVTRLSAFSCRFMKTFCGWTNTHMDDQNWQLGDAGVSALISENVEISWPKRSHRNRKQTADLFSPAVTVEGILDESESSSELCLTLSYEIHLYSAELSVILVPLQQEVKAGYFFNKGLVNGREIWNAGRSRTEGTHQARIPLLLSRLPSKFQILLRGVSLGSILSPKFKDWNEVGVTVQSVQLDTNPCPDVNFCGFDDGFCSWQISYTGPTVWHIIKTSDGQKNNSVAAVLSSGAHTDYTELISPLVTSGNKAQYLSFRYQIQSMRQCLQVVVVKISPDPDNDSGDGDHHPELLIWEQCRRKGQHWLQGCANLPLSKDDYKIILRSGTGPKDSILWVDDVHIIEGRCKLTQPQIEPAKSLDLTPYWECRPRMSLCGMSQPLLGSWDWIYVHNEKTSNGNVTSIDVSPDEGGSRGYFCNNGHIISIEAHCDGYADCPSGEDELQCDGLKDPFVCVNGDIISKHAKCDGYPDCIGGEDELHCAPEIPEEGFFCEEGTFPCPSGRSCPSETCLHPLNPCLTKDQLCDGRPDCKFGEDEKECGMRKGMPHHRKQWMSDPPQSALYQINEDLSLFSDRLVCSGGLMLPLAFRCDGRKDCPMDGLDEVGCFHCSANDYLCPTSGVCLPKSTVCDSEVSVPTCTDEIDCLVCPPAHFACDVCIKSYQLCDGVWDCTDGEDEKRCSSPPLQAGPPSERQNIHPGMGNSKTFIEESHSNCLEDQYQCSSGKCIQRAVVCNRKEDCSDKEDEIDCQDDNHEEEFHISAKYSPIRGAQSEDPSYLVSPVLHHLAGSNGLLSFRYRLDSWIGPSNVTLSIEMLHPNDSTLSLLPWSLWRQSANKGRFWLQDQIVIPDLDNLDSFRIAFVLSGSSSSGSDQLHLSRISYRMLEKSSFDAIGMERASCDFKRSWCGWTQPYSDRGYSWVYSETSPHARRTGPITGYYDGLSSGFVYADSLYGREGDGADILSPPITLPSADGAVCFRFAVFLYGAHVAKVSVHSYQTTPGKPHTSELYHAVGAKGLSWVPVSVSVTKSGLRDPTKPFLLVVRATKGSGPEADIALDHVSLLSGTCDNAASDIKILLKPALDPTSSRVHFLKAGSSSTRYIQEKGLIVHSGKGQIEQKNVSISTDSCVLLDTCSECVTSKSSRCSWCETTLTCANELSSETKSCSPYRTLYHNSSKEVQAGLSWCPRMVPGVDPRIFVPIHSSPALTFAVTNVQVTDTNSEWTCAYSIKGDADPNKDPNADVSPLESRPLDGPLLNEELRLLQALTENYKDESLWLQLKGIATGQMDVDGSVASTTTIKVPGRFQGSVFRTGRETSTSGVGIGAVRCDSSDTLFTSSKDVPEGHIRVSLIPPSGYALDNPSDIHLVLYQCSHMGKDCESCVQLNESYSCGWCSMTQKCESHESCKGGIWHSHSKTPVDEVCSVQEDLNILSTLLQEDYEYKPSKGQMWEDAEREEEEREEKDDEDDEAEGDISTKGHKKKVKNHMKKFLGAERRNKYEENSRRQSRRKRGKDKSRFGKNDQKNAKLPKKTKSKGFLRVPTQEGVFVARDVWRLHTGRQYYIPVKKKTLVNLGYVRQITYGSLAGEKSRTILVDSAWKKAAGYYIDMYEKADQDPVTSIVTTHKDIFDKIIAQLLPE